MIPGKRVLLIVGGGIAAYKSLDTIRRLRAGGASVRCILTRAGEKFVTPLSLSAISGEKVYGDLFSLTDESEMGHIRLSREADLVVVAPATADLMAKMAAGLADDLATTALLATDKPVLIAPAMNTRMWNHPATRRNLASLTADGIGCVGPGSGDLACGEEGEGRMAEPEEIVAAIAARLGGGGLAGISALVTSGPTFEAIDPVRYIANRSSGKQGHAIAAALARAGAAVTLVSGPTNQADPPETQVTRVETAIEMLAACEAALPVAVAVCAAAVTDWRVADAADRKIKKAGNGAPPRLKLVENPDILGAICGAGNRRPGLVVGFAAETEDIVGNARKKRRGKGCDWILANDVSKGSGVFGGERNRISLVDGDGVEEWPEMSKDAVAARLAERIAAHLAARRAEA